MAMRSLSLLIVGALAGCDSPTVTNANDAGGIVPDLSAPLDLSATTIDLSPGATTGDLAASEQPDLAGCAGDAGWSQLSRLPPAALHDLLAARHPLLINVHIPWAGDIPNTDARIAYTDVDAIAAQIGADPCREVVLYCLSGGMSVDAGGKLIARGYRRVYDLLGGSLAWEQAGYPINH